MYFITVTDTYQCTLMFALLNKYNEGILSEVLLYS